MFSDQTLENPVVYEFINMSSEMICFQISTNCIATSSK